MNKIILSLSFIFIFTLVVGSMLDTAQAQTDPSILLHIANQAQKQLENQISQDTSDTTKQLFTIGTQQVKALEESITNNDIDLAKKYFLSSMRIFKDVSKQLTSNHSLSVEMTIRIIPEDPSAELIRLQDYVDSMKKIAKKYSASIDFSELDSLFVTAKNHNIDNQNDEAVKIINKIKQITADINNKIREYASEKEQERAQEYAKKYVEQLDRLIENAKSQGLSKDVIQRLETSRENLFSATDTNDIIKQIRKIILIKEQFELTKNDQLEARVMEVEKIVIQLSNSDKLSNTDLEDLKKTLQTIKINLAHGDFEKANELLLSLTILEQFQD